MPDKNNLKKILKGVISGTGFLARLAIGLGSLSAVVISIKSLFKKHKKNT